MLNPSAGSRFLRAFNASRLLRCTTPGTPTLELLTERRGMGSPANAAAVVALEAVAAFAAASLAKASLGLSPEGEPGLWGIPFFMDPALEPLELPMEVNDCPIDCVMPLTRDLIPDIQLPVVPLVLALSYLKPPITPVIKQGHVTPALCDQLYMSWPIDPFEPHSCCSCICGRHDVKSTGMAERDVQSRTWTRRLQV